MTPIRLFTSLFLALLLAACGKPVPPEKAAYVGEWRSPVMSLRLMQDGSFKYKRVKEGVTTTIEAPLQAFEGDNFLVGVGSMTTTFVVSKPPYQDNGQWKMVVDGVELTRATVVSNVQLDDSKDW
jgi:hypothetical protein